MTNDKYYTFSIVLLKSFFADKHQTLLDIEYYSIYRHYVYLLNNATTEHVINITEIDRFKMAMKHYDLTADDFESVFNKCEKVYYNTNSDGVAMVSIKQEIIRRYMNYNEIEYLNICLLMFIAFKSILGNSDYKKTNKELLFNRMLGNNKAVVKLDELPSYLKKYSKEYQFNKMVNELELNWSLKYYSRHVRGFFFSFKLTFKRLVIVAESSKITKRKQLLKEQKAKIIDEVKKNLN